MTAKPKRATDPASEPPPAGAQPAPNATPASQTSPPGILPPTATNTSGFHAAVPQRQHVEARPTGKRLTLLSLGALGIVYGDIGTSPL